MKTPLAISKLRLVEALVMVMILIMPLQVSAQDVLALETDYEKARFKLAVETVLSIKEKNSQIAQSLDQDYPKVKEDRPIVQLLYFENLLSDVWGGFKWTDTTIYSDYSVFCKVSQDCEKYARRRETLERSKTRLDEEREQTHQEFAVIEAEFPGGLEAMYRFISENLHYPDIARESNITGTVIVKFVVEKDGSISRASVVREIGGG